jgi:hypothetical protein
MGAKKGWIMGGCYSYIVVRGVVRGVRSECSVNKMRWRCLDVCHVVTDDVTGML